MDKMLKVWSHAQIVSLSPPSEEDSSDEEASDEEASDDVAALSCEVSPEPPPQAASDIAIAPVSNTASNFFFIDISSFTLPAGNVLDYFLFCFPAVSLQCLLSFACFIFCLLYFLVISHHFPGKEKY